MKSYIKPFERVLALRELRSISGVEPRALGLFDETSIDFEVRASLDPRDLAEKLAYWEFVERDHCRFITNQSLRESTVNLIRNGVAIDSLRRQLPFQSDVPLPNRRCLRYGTHGLHEYRGKFFPQLVRSLINISGVPAGGIIADPMSGSGTAIVESVLSGHKGLGLDINPLSVFIGKTKARLLAANAARLATCFEQVQDALQTPNGMRKKGPSYLQSLPASDQRYLSSWFSEHALKELDHISSAIGSVRDGRTRDLMRISLSNILRNVSWQKTDDLRVRKEVRSDDRVDPTHEFLDELGRAARSVLAFLLQNGPVRKPQFDVAEGDARRCSETWGTSQVDLVITSPPYATALPYLDTDRLSLCYLGLLPRRAHRTREQMMIGNREVTEKLRRCYWDRFEAQGSMLPDSVTALIRKIALLNSTGGAGFRRRNLPSLLAKYFFDMKDVLSETYSILKPGGFAYMIVGDNHTIAGGTRMDIRTAALLEEIAAATGFEVAEALPMDMLVSRDIFKKNTVASEAILALRRPPHK
jgi:DNA modification methylase